MHTLVSSHEGLEQLHSGSVWTEGPLWLPATKRVRWSDIPNNRILEWDQVTGVASVYRKPAEYTNGRALDAHGRVVQCSHGRRALEREDAAGLEVLVERWEGGHFNSPNDLAVVSDGSIWFTDPPYGLHPSGREGYPGEQEYEGCFVFRFDLGSGIATPVITSMVHPNGIAFSPDETVLYVSDTGTHEHQPDSKCIMTFPVKGSGVGRGRVFARVPVGAADGFAIDREARVWTSAGDGVYVYSPAGELLGHIPVPETVSNVCFGGENGDELFITASTSLYRIRTMTTGAL
ncbi:SMP-30/gluconolactonase/LRE family protein [uncultured Arthrobacter sp.]|uniref:SMP-30/gluconolactonase/LRE family protein n=1 Tax=uncultured Arthrobacter sp. TaxID=114050 RepID=UPI00261EE260|nr:SMP-30/gluconolactonase/LRE family protein [uncultured Arthrobacter sp.]